MSTPISEVVLATNNPKKLAELRRIVDAAGLEVSVLGLADLPSYPEPAETETTFEGNALLKARAAVQNTGVVALADDSGLQVDVLNQMPGIRTARWAGAKASDEANRRLVLAQIDDVPDEGRTARFVCAVALVTPEGDEHVIVRTLEGRLTHEEIGDNGFGYDPIFIPAGMSVSSAQLSPGEKDSISHRGIAVRAFARFLAELA